MKWEKYHNKQQACTKSKAQVHLDQALSGTAGIMNLPMSGGRKLDANAWVRLFLGFFEIGCLGWYDSWPLFCCRKRKGWNWTFIASGKKVPKHVNQHLPTWPFSSFQQIRCQKCRVVYSKVFWNFQPECIFKMAPFLTNIFQMGWNHQLSRKRNPGSIRYILVGVIGLAPFNFLKRPATKYNV